VDLQEVASGVYVSDAVPEAILAPKQKGSDVAYLQAFMEASIA
jgi:hypothetical protein